MQEGPEHFTLADLCGLAGWHVDPAHLDLLSAHLHVVAVESLARVVQTPYLQTGADDADALSRLG